LYRYTEAGALAECVTRVRRENAEEVRRLVRENEENERRLHGQMLEVGLHSLPGVTRLVTWTPYWLASIN
jgi:hypothetical protein